MQKTGHTPKGWSAACKTASRIHIDEMWSLLELHYDEWYFNRWKDKDGRAPQRKGEYKAAPIYSNTIDLAAVVDVVLPRLSTAWPPLTGSVCAHA